MHLQGSLAQSRSRPRDEAVGVTVGRQIEEYRKAQVVITELACSFFFAVATLTGRTLVVLTTTNRWLCKSQTVFTLLERGP